MLEKRHKDAWQLAESLFEQVLNVTHQPYGHASLTFEINSSSGDYILKTKSEKDAFRYTQHHIEVLSGINVSVPKIVVHGQFSDFDYLILSKIHGQDLGYVLGEMTQFQMTKLAQEIVRIEQTISGLPEGEGFGWTPIMVPGPFATWNDVIERDSRTSPNYVRDEILKWQSYFETVRPTCFLDDLTVKNVIVKDGVFQGIVDLDNVCYGDPLYWLSLAEVTSILDVGQRASFYGEELRRLWKMTDESAAVCDLYNVIQAWFFLGKGEGSNSLASWTDQRFERLVHWQT